MRESIPHFLDTFDKRQTVDARHADLASIVEKLVSCCSRHKIAMKKHTKKMRGKGAFVVGIVPKLLHQRYVDRIRINGEHVDESSIGGIADDPFLVG